MTGRGLRSTVVVGLVALSGIVSGVEAQKAPLWGDLQPGAWDVGFTSEWILDTGRTYEAVFDDGSSYGDHKAPRPLLVNTWYPALPDSQAPRMPHRGYLQLDPVGSRSTSMASSLVRYNEAVVAEEVTGRGSEEHDARTAALFRAVLDTPTASRRDAPAARGSFPIVLYHAGHGSSFEDNSVLCEFLASHGYIVIGSAFQRGDGSGLEPDTRAASVADLDALIRHAGGLEGADWTRVALVGHSGGAHVAFRYAVRPGSAVDAYVFLDTTQDYWGFSVEFWPYVEQVLENREQLAVPILLAASPHAVFMLADSLSSSDRYYVTLDGLDHNEFISQGLMASDFRSRARHDAMSEAVVVSDAPATYQGEARVMERYNALVRYVFHFLEGHLRKDEEALQGLRDSAPGPLGSSGHHVAYVPQGAMGPPPYEHPADRPPTPRQMRPLLDRVGVERTLEILRSWIHADAASPVLSEREFAVAWLHELVTADRRDEARRLYGFFSLVHEDLIEAYLRWHDLLTAMEDPVEGQRWLEIARALDADHPGVRSRSSGGL